MTKHNNRKKVDMKKIMIVVVVALAAACSNADVLWDWWCGNAGKTPVVHLGIACKADSVKAAEVSLLFNRTPVLQNGAQVCLGFNYGDDVNNGAQVSLFFNRAKSVKWVQAALVNCAKSAKVQAGLLNFNESGFLPFFPFFNLDKSLFD